MVLFHSTGGQIYCNFNRCCHLNNRYLSNLQMVPLKQVMFFYLRSLCVSRRRHRLKLCKNLCEIWRKFWMKNRTKIEKKYFQKDLFKFWVIVYDLVVLFWFKRWKLMTTLSRLLCWFEDKYFFPVLTLSITAIDKTCLHCPSSPEHIRASGTEWGRNLNRGILWAKKNKWNCCG